MLAFQRSATCRRRRAGKARKRPRSAPPAGPLHAGRGGWEGLPVAGGGTGEGGRAGNGARKGGSAGYFHSASSFSRKIQSKPLKGLRQFLAPSCSTMVDPEWQQHLGKGEFAKQPHLKVRGPAPGNCCLQNSCAATKVGSLPRQSAWRGTLPWDVAVPLSPHWNCTTKTP